MHIVKRQWQSPILKRIACKERAKFTNEFHARVNSLSRFRIHKGLFEDVRTSMYVAHSAPSLARARVQRFILFVRRRAFPEKWGLHAASLSCACAPRLRESFSGLALVPTAGPAPSVTFVARFPRLQIASLSIVYSEEGET